MLLNILFVFLGYARLSEPSDCWPDHCLQGIEPLSPTYHNLNQREESNLIRSVFGIEPNLTIDRKTAYNTRLAKKRF